MQGKYLPERNNKAKSPASYILSAMLLAGFLDIATALIMYAVTTHKSPVRVLEFIASGVFGKTAFSNNPMMIFWGLLFHFIIAGAFTIFFFWLSSMMSFLTRQPVISGLLYGIFVWMIMNLVVLPMSAVPKLPFDIYQAIKGIIILMLMVGLPVSLIAHKYYSGK